MTNAPVVLVVEDDPLILIHSHLALEDAGFTALPVRDANEALDALSTRRDIHALFISLVKESRGARLKGADDVLFTGEYWAGEKSVSLGLADGIGDLRSTLRARYGEKVLTPVIVPPSGLLSGLLGRRAPGAGSLGGLEGIRALPDDLISALETRAIWAKFGL